MFMELPEKFNMPYVRIKDNNLLIYEMKRYEDIMYQLTYAQRKKRCIYCGKKLNLKNRTLDHRYPRQTGGVSIVNNLYPCCSKCNSSKGNLTHKEYLHLKSLPDKDKKLYKETLEKERLDILKYVGFRLPRKWIDWLKIEDISYDAPTEIFRGKKYCSLKKHYEKYGNLPKPLIVDKNNKLLNGFNIMLFAMDNHIEKVPAIRLENVILMK